MKKILAIVLAMVMIFAATGVFAADIKVLVNGEEIQFDRLPEEKDGAVLIPFRFVAEKLGAIVAWDGETQTVFANIGDTLSTMQIGNKNVFVNSEAVEADVAPYITIDRTFVSTQILEKALGATVVSDGSTVTITK